MCGRKYKFVPVLELLLSLLTQTAPTKAGLTSQGQERLLQVDTRRGSGSDREQTFTSQIHTEMLLSCSVRQPSPSSLVLQKRDVCGRCI